MPAHLRSRMTIATVLTLAPAPVLAATTASFTLLGDLPGGTFRSEGLGLSADGLIALGRSWVEPNANSYEAFRWSAALGLLPLGHLPGPTVLQSRARDANTDGSVIVGTSFSTEGEQAFLWTESTGLVGLGDLPDTSYSSRANAVNGDGTIVVGSHLGSAVTVTRRKAWVWTAESGMVSLGTPTLGCEAFDISRTGLVIVGYTATSGATIKPAKWTPEDGWVLLGSFPGGSVNGFANATNTDGSIIVGGSGSSFSSDPFMWTEATGMVGLGTLPGQTHSGPATGVSADGSRVVGASWLWTPGTGIVPMTPTLRNILGMRIVGAIIGAPSISDDGRTIVARVSGPTYNPATDTTIDTEIACRITLPGPGACCIGGACVDDVDPIACATFCGIFVSDQDTCASVACQNLGACVFLCARSPTPPCPDSTSAAARHCVVLPEADCIAAGGLFLAGDCNCIERDACAFDITGDNRVDASDFTVLAAHFGQGDPDCRAGAQGDLNCDGLVNAADFVILAGDFGCGT